MTGDPQDELRLLLYAVKEANEVESSRTTNGGGGPQGDRDQQVAVTVELEQVG